MKPYPYETSTNRYIYPISVIGRTGPVGRVRSDGSGRTGPVGRVQSDGSKPLKSTVFRKKVRTLRTGPDRTPFPVVWTHISVLRTPSKNSRNKKSTWVPKKVLTNAINWTNKVKFFFSIALVWILGSEGTKLLQGENVAP